MALTYTPELPIGTPCPKFKLNDVTNKQYTLDDFNNCNVLVIMFICNHCPYVQAANDYDNNDVQFIGICSNDAADFPEDSPENLRQRWIEKKYNFPYLVDHEQSVAKAFSAVCTPDIFVYNNSRKLIYRGRFDDSWKDPSKVEVQELKVAIDNELKGKAPQTIQHPSMGCSIKWSAQ